VSVWFPHVSVVGFDVVAVVVNVLSINHDLRDVNCIHLFRGRALILSR
jgi:hypothetical protein